MKHLEGKWEIPQSCGCIVNTRTGKVKYCKLHKAAPELLKLLTDVLEAVNADVLDKKALRKAVEAIKNATS